MSMGQSPYPRQEKPTDLLPVSGTSIVCLSCWRVLSSSAVSPDSGVPALSTSHAGHSGTLAELSFKTWWPSCFLAYEAVFSVAQIHYNCRKPPLERFVDGLSRLKLKALFLKTAGQHCGPCPLCSGIVFGLYQMTHSLQTSSWYSGGFSSLTPSCCSHVRKMFL